MPIEFTSFISGGLIFAGCTSGVNVWREWANPTDDYWPNIGASSTADDSSAEGHRSYILRLPTGTNSNSSMSSNAPWQSMAKVNAFKFGAGSSVLFEGGQSFTGCLKFSSRTNVRVLACRR